MKGKSLMVAMTALVLAVFGGVGCNGDGAGGAPSIDVNLVEWGVTASPSSASAGEVTFQARNTGTLAHELVVIQTDRAPDALVVVGGRVDEAASGTLIGEIEEDVLGPGRSASDTFTLPAGSYVLICNIISHYEAGMHTGFQVN